MVPNRAKLGLIGLVLFAAATNALAAGGLPVTIDYFSMILHSLHIDHQWLPTIGALFVTGLVVVLGLMFKREMAVAEKTGVPSGKFSITFLFEGIMEFVYTMTKENCGKNYRSYLPLMSTIFVFILIANVSGLVPGFPPTTGSMDMNLAMGVIVFFVYNYAGLKEHGGGYVKHFLGPVALIAPLFFTIELISHSTRPFSLGLRLAANVFADHTLVGVFTGLTYFVVPALLMFFGLLVSVVQAFVFALLTGIYISLAISHDH